MPLFQKKVDTKDTEESYENRDFDNIFGYEKKSFRIYLYSLLTELRNIFKKDEDKKLIFDKGFFKYLRENKSLKSLIKNSKSEKRSIPELIKESKKIIQNIFNDYKEKVKKDREKITRIEDIFGDIIVNNSGFGVHLYILLHNAIFYGEKINEDIIFSENFLKYIYNTHGAFLEKKYKQYKNKNNFEKDEELKKILETSYKNYQQDVQKNLDEMNKNEKKYSDDKQENLNDDIKQSDGGKLTDMLLGYLRGGSYLGTVGLGPTSATMAGFAAAGTASAATAAFVATSDRTTEKAATSGSKNTSADNDSIKARDKNTNETIMKDVVSIIRGTDEYKNIKELLESNGAIEVNEQNIISYCISLNPEKLKKAKEIPEGLKDEILKRAGEVRKYLNENFRYDFEFAEREKKNISSERINEIVLEVNQIIKQAWTIGSSDFNFHSIKDKIKRLVEDKKHIRAELTNKDSWIDYITHKMESYLNSNAVNLNDGGRRGITMLYASILQHPIDIDNDNDLKNLLKTICGENTKFTNIFNEFTNKRTNREYERKYNYAANSIIKRYEIARAEAENRKFYSDTLINFTKTSNNPQDQSGLQIANGIDNIDKKLNNYKLKSNITKHKEAALRYTAFDTTFNNTFSLNNITIQKLAKSSIDLRSELINYGIYNQENNYFNKDARNKFVSDKIGNIGLTPEEIETLGKTMEELPSEVEKNYEILCGDFYSDQDSIEKITKIYALGEIIDKIRFLFSNIDKQKLGNFMDIQLDENEPANVIGDCLFIKGKINGTETNIKYNLRTGKLYMNSFTKQSLNPPMIIVGNTNPDKEIGDLGSFEETISSMDSIFQIQDNEENGEQPGNLGENNSGDNSSDDKDSKQQNGQDPERLIKNKLSNDLKNIGRIAKEKAGEQGKENNVVDDLLKTFNILPDYGEPKDIEFMGGSALFDLLESIINTNNENDLLEFSNQMKRLMSLCELSRGKNNENPEKSEFNSVTIFDFNEDNATTDIISLQRAQKKFFSKESGEKDKIKGSKSHFDSSIQLSFADIIVQRCCKDMGNGMEISIIDLERYVDSIEDGLDISNCETKMEEAYN